MSVGILQSEQAVQDVQDVEGITSPADSMSLNPNSASS